MRNYIYPQNLKASANIWFWTIRDFVILAIALLISVVVVVELRWLLPAALTLCFAFLKATQKYNELVPLYNKEMDDFNNNKLARIDNLTNTISLNKEALNNLYTSTRLVSASYRDLAILQWLYEDMSTSDHDLRYAMELLDRDRQRVATLQAAEITAKAIAMQTEIMHEDMGEMYDELLRGNESLEDIMNGQSKLKRDNNIANGVSIFQRWLYHKN